MSKRRCGGCGHEVDEKYIQTYVVGELQDYTEWSMLGHTDYEFVKNNHSRGEVCPFCSADGNIPLSKRLRPNVDPITETMLLMGAFMLLVLLVVLLI